MKPEQDDLAPLASLLEKAGPEFSYPPARDVRAAVRERLEAEAQRRRRPTRWILKWRRRWLIAVPAISLLAALITVVYVTYFGESTAPVERTAPVEPTAPIERAAPVEPTAPLIVSIAAAPGGGFVAPAVWAVNLDANTMTRLGPEGEELGTFDVGTGLDLVGVALTEESEAPLAGVYVHGNYAFVGGMSTGYTTDDNIGIRIVDLSDPANPELVGRIPLRNRAHFGRHSHGDAVATHIDTDAFQGDIAIVISGVPDTYVPKEYPHPYGIWDVTDPSKPQLLSVLNLGKSSHKEEGDLGDKPHDLKAVSGRYFFTLYANAEKPIHCLRPDSRGQRASDCPPWDDHMAVVDLSDPRNPIVVGDWHDSGLEGSLRGLSINKAGTRAYVVSIGPPPYGTAGKEVILYILDIQDPNQPVEIARYVYPYPGPWVHSPYAVPNDDDSLVILADGRWQNDSDGCSGHGRLHFLDITDLKAIREVGTFRIDESDTCFPKGLFQATDMAVKGNLVYSTWLRGGLHVVDISDPTNPVAVGEFRAPDKKGPWLSDVALYSDESGDYAFASTVWWSGLYVVKLRNS